MKIKKTSDEKEICWNITARCNLKCKYCHRFLNIGELSTVENEKILTNLIKKNVKKISWTGGEPLLYPGLTHLLEIAHKNKISNNLITNGKLLDAARINVIAKYLTSLTLSIDSLDDKVNDAIGRGAKYYQNILTILENIKQYPEINVRINSVASELSIDDFCSLIDLIDKYKIKNWRIFRFMDLREQAIANKSIFNVSDLQFATLKKKVLENIGKDCIVEFREKSNMEKNYILIVANGDIIITEDGKDRRLGSSLTMDDVSLFL